MAKVRTKGFKKVPLRLVKQVAGALRGNTELSEAILTDIKDTLRGEGVFSSPRLLDGSKIKPLKKSTIDRRRKLQEINTTHPSYKANRSNLTFSGQFIDSFKIRFSRKGRTIIYKARPTGVHKGGKNLNGSRQRGVSNIKIGARQVALGRDYTSVGPRFIKRIRKRVVKAIGKVLRL